MEVNAKLKEIEDEIKVIKAEIRNVLLDIRETILERTNPLEGSESVNFRMDLRTTASAMAAEAAAHEAHEAAAHAPGVQAAADGAAGEEPAALPGEEPEAAGPEAHEEEPPPKVIRRDPRELKMLAEERARAEERAHADEGRQPLPRFGPEPAGEPRTEVPPMYRRSGVEPLSANGSLSAWLYESLQAVGPREVERIITIERSWGNLPPNINRALALVQELLGQTQDDDPEPVWLHIMRELDRLAAL